MRGKSLSARMEEWLSLVLDDFAKATNRTVGEVLEEIVLHSVGPISGQEGVAVARPHSAETFGLIEQFKKKHGVDYDTHGNYGFIEVEVDESTHA